MDHSTNIYAIMDRVISWSKRKQYLRTSDFVSVFLNELKTSSKDFYRFNTKHINCQINSERVLTYFSFEHPNNFERSNVHIINDALQHYRYTSLAFEGVEEVAQSDFTFKKIKDFKF